MSKKVMDYLVGRIISLENGEQEYLSISDGLIEDKKELMRRNDELSDLVDTLTRNNESLNDEISELKSIIDDKEEEVLLLQEELKKPVVGVADSELLQRVKKLMKHDRWVIDSRGLSGEINMMRNADSNWISQDRLDKVMIYESEYDIIIRIIVEDGYDTVCVIDKKYLDVEHSESETKKLNEKEV